MGADADNFNVFVVLHGIALHRRNVRGFVRLPYGAAFRFHPDHLIFHRELGDAGVAEVAAEYGFAGLFIGIVLVGGPHQHAEGNHHRGDDGDDQERGKQYLSLRTHKIPSFSLFNHYTANGAVNPANYKKYINSLHFCRITE